MKLDLLQSIDSNDANRSNSMHINKQWVLAYVRYAALLLHVLSVVRTLYHKEYQLSYYERISLSLLFDD